MTVLPIHMYSFLSPKMSIYTNKVENEVIPTVLFIQIDTFLSIIVTWDCPKSEKNTDICIFIKSRYIYLIFVNTHWYIICPTHVPYAHTQKDFLRQKYYISHNLNVLL